MKINVTAEQLAAAIQANEEALVHAIRDCGKSHPPGDGTIGLLYQNIRALEILAGHQKQQDLAAQMGGSALGYAGILDKTIEAADQVDVGANEQTGARVTVKKRVVHGRKDG